MMDNFEDFMRVSEECLEDIEHFERSPFNLVITERLRKTLYFGRDTPACGHAHPLTDLATQLFKNANQSTGKRSVDTKYVSNVARKSSISPCTLMVALIYLERLRHKNPNYLHNVASTDLFLVTMMIATKFAYDEGEEEEMFNDEWAKAGNTDTESVHKLEQEFLSAIDWDLFVRPPDFLKCLNQVEQTIALKEGSRRGWFSYTDLSVILNNPDYHQAILTMMAHIIKIMCACVLTYSFMATTAVFYVVAFNQFQPPTLDASTHSLLFGPFANSATTQANLHFDTTYVELILKMSTELSTENISTDHSYENHNHIRNTMEESIVDGFTYGLVLNREVVLGRPIIDRVSSELGFNNNSENNGQKSGVQNEHIRLSYPENLITWRDAISTVSTWLYCRFNNCVHIPYYSNGLHASY